MKTDNFKIGDKIILINNMEIDYDLTIEDMHLYKETAIENITLYKEYTIISKIRNKMIVIINDEGNHRNFKQHRFLTIKQYRKEKIEKLNSL